MEKALKETKAINEEQGMDKNERIKLADVSVRNLIKNKTILKAKVLSANIDEEKGDYVALYYNNREFVIYKNELDYQMDVTGVLNFIDRAIYFVAIDYEPDTKRIVASRTIAQKAFKEKIIKEVGEDKVYKGVITSVLQYGAYVEIEGGVTGLLKNKSFAMDHLVVGDMFTVGDELDVKILNLYADNKIALTVPNLFSKSVIPDLERYKVDSAVSAKVVSIKDWGFYARILPAVDIMCSLPQEEEILIGSKVLVKIKEKNVRDGELFMRGKWLRTLKRVDD